MQRGSVIGHWSLLIAHCSLLIAHCSLLIAHCSFVSCPWLLASGSLVIGCFVRGRLLASGYWIQFRNLATDAHSGQVRMCSISLKCALIGRFEAGNEGLGAALVRIGLCQPLAERCDGWGGGGFDADFEEVVGGAGVGEGEGAAAV
jgi:hypothetical protein